MLDAARFKARFYAFRNAPDSLVNEKLAEAYGIVSEESAGNLRDSLAGNYAAHLLAMEPEGKEVRIATGNGGGSSTYLSEFNRIAAMVVVPIRVV